MQLISQISHDDLKEMLSLSIWVHELGEHVDESETSLSFMYGVDLSKTNSDKQHAIEYLYRTQQSGLVASYTDDITNGLQVAITVNTSSHRICVVFRGADDRYVWLNHSRAQQINIGGGVKVHTGLKNLIDTHEEVLNRSIDQLLFRYPKYEIFVTGHCLGGALAHLYGYLLALRLQEREMETNVSVVSFGSPCVGNYAFRLACDALVHLNTTRVATSHDHFTSLPVANYFHVGKTVLLLLAPSGCTVYTDYAYPFWLFAVPYCMSVTTHSAEQHWIALCKAEVEEGLMQEESRLLGSTMVTSPTSPY